MGGDPAELMRICVENGTFTVSFLKEGVQKVSTLMLKKMMTLMVQSSFAGGSMIF